MLNKLYKHFRTTLLLIFLCWNFPVATAAEYLKILYISDSTTVCTDTQSCLLVREAPEKEWTALTRPIRDFNYTKGFSYCLLVNVAVSAENDTTYTLQEIKSRTAVNATIKESINNTLPDSSKWLLYKLRMKDGSTKTFSLAKAHLQFFPGAQTLTGSTDCNTFSATITLQQDSMQIADILLTKMACGKHSIESRFVEMLQNTNKYKVNGKLLYLYKDDRLLGLFSRKK
ncbi:MAG TPA: META domain-containing protein [Chitinophagales bacterium]|jgi:heat shock protein HslJ|nr:META domain-containing protein [Chitinophagales bacterium]